MGAGSRRRIRAVRLRPNIVVPQLAVGDDGTIAVVPGAGTASPGRWADSLKAKLVAVQRAVGLDERQFRERLRGDEQLSPLADAEFPEPRRSVTPSEAELLIERGLADPVFDAGEGR
jgi:hypothetical protein